MSRNAVRALNRTVAGAPSRENAEEALVVLLERSVRFGHRRLTVRRYLMLQACGRPVSSAVQAHCDNLIGSMPAQELMHIERAVADWRSKAS